MSSDERLDLNAIEARANAATPGPWAIPAGTLNGKAYRVGPIEGYDFDALCLAPDDPDLTFVAHARTDVPALIAEVRSLRDRLANIESFARGLESCGRDALAREAALRSALTRARGDLFSWAEMAKCVPDVSMIDAALAARAEGDGS